LANDSARPYLKNPLKKIGMVESLKVEGLSSSPVLKKKSKINKQNKIKTKT
jgi:FMN-dependent NADH-azoreductase